MLIRVPAVLLYQKLDNGWGAVLHDFCNFFGVPYDGINLLYVYRMWFFLFYHLFLEKVILVRVIGFKGSGLVWFGWHVLLSENLVSTFLRISGLNFCFHLCIIFLDSRGYRTYAKFFHEWNIQRIFSGNLAVVLLFGRLVPIFFSPD